MNNGNTSDVTTADSSSFKYKSIILGDLVADGANGVLKKRKDSRAFKISIQLFQVARNVIG